MAARPFSPPVVLRNIDASLPPNTPQLRTPHDAIAVFVHACLLSVGFRLVGLSEDDQLEPAIEGSNPQPLPETWNASPGNYGFRYAHAQSPLNYLIKVNRLGTKTIIMGLGLGDDNKAVTFDIPTKDYFKDDFFPYTLQPTQPLENAFVSASSISDLAALVKIHIVQNLVGKQALQEEEENAAEASRQQQQQQQQQPRNQPREDFDESPYRADPLRYPPRPANPPIPAGGETPPGFDDDYEILQPPRGGYGNAGGRHPLSIGADDLNPPGLGSNPPLRGPFFGEGRGGGLGGGMGPMGGMHPTGDHPMFGGQGGEGVPDPRFPPGARYDPVGPGDAPMGGLRGPRGPGRGGPPFGGGFGGGYGGFGGNDFI
ncbi:PI31 proteasome regulator N-terminal-domain-containing protein [Morchella snyderi]|nr:PI31 proteasome regulator N-terminal-domain-containing protein [Morchella snyderi]